MDLYHFELMPVGLVRVAADMDCLGSSPSGVMFFFRPSLEHCFIRHVLTIQSLGLAERYDRIHGTSLHARHVRPGL